MNISVERIIEKIRLSNNVIIYGAGDYAKIFYTYIQLKNLDDNVKFFVVTDIENVSKEIGGKSVMQFSDVVTELENSLVVIAMSSKTNSAVYKNLTAEKIYSLEVVSDEELSAIAAYISDYFNDLPIQKNKIFIECFAGMGYRCNCKYIAKQLIENNNPVEIIWTVTDIDIDMPREIKQIKRFSTDYFREIYTAGIYVGNDNHSIYVHKKEGQYYINTWHGSGPFKKVNASLFEGDKSKQQEFEERFRCVDLFVSNTGDNTEMFRESFCYHGEIYECGSPRNDIFFRQSDVREKLCTQLGIDKTKKILIYAPTFRDGDEGSFAYYDLDMERVLQALEQRFGEEFVLMYRFHHRLYKFKKGRDFYPNAVNATLYPDMQELLVAADVLITDYSSTMWDFSLQDRPIFLYHNDENEYENDRGFYCPVKEWPYIKAHTSEEMVEAILNFDNEQYLKDVHLFIDKYKSFDDGCASKKVVDRIMQVIGNRM